MPESITLTDEAGDTLAVSALSSYTYITVTEGDQATEVELSNEQAGDLGRALLSGTDEDSTDALARGGFADERQEYNAEVFSLALTYGRLVVFQYEKEKGPGGVIEKRRVKPDEAYRSGEGDPIVVGFDPDRGGTRAFRLDRVVGFAKVG